MTKQYDRAYYRRWYHDSRSRVTSTRALERKVHLAVSAAELFLARRIRSVLDVGCGEALWYPVLRRIRRDVDYVGVEQSEYALAEFGKSRHIRRGSFGALRSLRLSPRFDLVVCADVLQYVPDEDLAPGLREIRRLLGGVAYIEAHAREDDMEGDMEGWHFRSAAELRRRFQRAGLTSCGMYCWIDERKLTGVNRLEVCAVPHD